MARLLEFKLNETDTAVAYIEAQPAPGEIAPAGALDDAIKKVEESLEHVLAVAGAIGCSFWEAIRDVPAEKTELELGFQFTGKGTIYVVQSEAKASLKAKFTFGPRKTT